MDVGTCCTGKMSYFGYVMILSNDNTKITMKVL
jgi:hypothetical protein